MKYNVLVYYGGGVMIVRDLSLLVLKSYVYNRNQKGRFFHQDLLNIP